MLQINHLTITHLKDMRTLIEDFSFYLQQGDKAAIIGEEGNGKSTLLKLIYDEKLVDDYCEYTGEILRDSQKMGYLAQELSKEKVKKSVYEFCMEVPLFSYQSPKDLANIAAQLGLEADFFYTDQQVETLSGGEKVKLQLACLLMEKPDVLLLDEPSNDIDMDTLEWLEKFINSAEIPVLFISHDETLLENIANKIIHIEQVKRKTKALVTVEKCGYTEYVTKRMHSLETTEQLARNERKEFVKKQERFREIQSKVEASRLKQKMHTVKAMEKRYEKEYQSMTEIPDPEEAIFMKLSDKVRIPNGKVVLHYEQPRLTITEPNQEKKVLANNLFLEIIGPQKVCIVGKNGIGKSTMLKEIATQMLERKDIHTFYMPQNYEDLLDLNKTPVEFLTTTGEKEENIRICTYLGSMKYTADEMGHPIRELSGGQKAKLFLLQMSMSGSDVLILDEPTRNFSPLSNPVIRRLLIEFKGAIISVSHDRKYINEVCDTIYQLTEEGMILQSDGMH